MSKKILTEKRNADIYREYLKEFDKGYRNDIICERLGKKFYMKAATVLLIVTKEARKIKTVESGTVP